MISSCGVRFCAQQAALVRPAFLGKVPHAYGMGEELHECGVGKEPRECGVGDGFTKPGCTCLVVVWRTKLDKTLQRIGFEVVAGGHARKAAARASCCRMSPSAQ